LKYAASKSLAVGITLSATVACYGQIPDLMTSLDPGSRSAGAAGAFQAVEADSLSPFFNPAGLGYIRARTFGVSFGSVPRSRSTLMGFFNSPQRDTRGESGAQLLTHVGYTMPFGRGTLGVSYDVAGYLDDVATGPLAGLPDVGGGFDVRAYTERRYSRTDTLSVAYGASNAAENLTYGAGVVFAQNSARYSETGVDPTGTWQPVSRSSNGSGVGLIAGVQHNLAANPNVSLGASVRTPIAMGGLVSRLPGRVLVGGAYRMGGLRANENDFALIGVQLQNYFGGARDAKFDRTSQSGISVGAEYHLNVGNGDVPLRIGFLNLSGGGNDFSSRNAISYGLGFRSGDRQYSLDFSWTRFGGSGTFFSAAATYRF
jgi:hypothetical protein